MKGFRLASEVLLAWSRILKGYKPILSIEITRECPLSCPGCYAYNTDHLGGAITLRQVRDKKGAELVQGIVDLIREYRPLHVSLVGGEPLVRTRELDQVLPILAEMGLHVQVVTSAVRAIPIAWASIPNLRISVSVDGLQPEHDQRRKPATYDRILKNISGHHITIHCTITRQQLQRDDYLEEFVRFWSSQGSVEKIWMSLYTPQKNEVSKERLTMENRAFAISQLLQLRKKYAKLDMPEPLIQVYANPPEDPSDCIFASASTCISADLQKRITPCQFGGEPDCRNCGCMASAGLAAIGRHRLSFGIETERLFRYSQKVGTLMACIRQRNQAKI